jgi:CheY-like chemotaxis protein
VATYLIKPIKPAELLIAIRRALGQLPVATPQRPKEMSKPATGSLHVLVAEDNLVNQTLAAKLLQKLGHTTVVAANGAEAIQRWESESFDLILMDVQMPGVDGFQATARIRQAEQKSGEHVPIVAMTAYAMSGDRERCLEAGMDGYVSKPVSRAVLEETLARHACHTPAET